VASPTVASELRPLGLGELLDRTITLWIRTLVKGLAIVALVLIPFALVFAIAAITIFVGVRPSYAGLAAPLVLIVVLAVPLLVWMVAAFIQFQARSYLGLPPSVWQPYRMSTGRILPLIGQFIIAFTATMREATIAVLSLGG